MRSKNRTAAPPFKRWRGLPTQLPDPLYTVSFFSRATAVELFRAASALTEDYEGRISTSGDWMDWILGRVLLVHGKQRNNIKRNLRELKEAGIIQVGDGFVTVCVGQPLAGARPDTTAETSPDSRPDFATTSRRLRPDFAIESSNCNHSTHELQNRTRTEQEQKTESSCERAREAVDQVIAMKPLVHTPTAPAGRASRLILEATTREFHPAAQKHREQLAALGGKPQAEWDKATAVLRLEAQKSRVANMLTPEHILANWRYYANGEAPPNRNSIAAERAMPIAAAGGSRYREL